MTPRQAMLNIGSGYPAWIQWTGWLFARMLVAATIITFLAFAGNILIDKL